MSAMLIWAQASGSVTLFLCAELGFKIALVFIKEGLRPISLGLIRSAGRTSSRNKITLA